MIIAITVIAIMVAGIFKMIGDGVSSNNKAARGIAAFWIDILVLIVAVQFEQIGAIIGIVLCIIIPIMLCSGKSNSYDNGNTTFDEPIRTHNINYINDEDREYDEWGFIDFDDE